MLNMHQCMQLCFQQPSNLSWHIKESTLNSFAFRFFFLFIFECSAVCFSKCSLCVAMSCLVSVCAYLVLLVGGS